MSEQPELTADDFEIRREMRFCVYHKGEHEPVAVSKEREAADLCVAMLVKNSWPWWKKVSK